MKYILIITLLFLYPLKEYCQKIQSAKDGYKLINKAKIEIEKAHLNKAEIYLDKAKKCNYGFCGNAWFTAFEDINLLKYNIHFLRKEYEKALYHLDSINGCGFGVNCETRDSLVVRTLIIIYGKNKVKEAFNNIHEAAIKADESSYNYSIYIPELNYTFNFECFNYKVVVIDNIKRVLVKNNTDILNDFKNAKFIQQLE